MNSYPSIDELEITLETGQGVAIILEGERYEDDPWFFRCWFDGRAKEATFFPQDGWRQVMAAVAELRSRCPNVPVYGIVDRDFCEDDLLDSDFEARGVLRTSRHTLENYLLDPYVWAAVFKLLAHNPNDAKGWNNAEQVRNFIAEGYENCLCLAAYNFTVKTISDLHAGQPSFESRDYLTNAKAFDNPDDVVNSLQNWGKKLGTADNPAEMFEQRLRQLQQAPFAEWEKQVHGRYVLKYLHDRFPTFSGKSKFPLDQYLNLYMDKCLTAPADLESLIDRIISHAVASRTS